VADRPLTEDQMMGETLALVLGDTKIWSAGTFWERNKFTNRTLFAPFAYKTQLNTRKFKMEDLARLNDTREVCFIIIEVWLSVSEPTIIRRSALVQQLYSDMGSLLQ